MQLYVYKQNKTSTNKYKIMHLILYYLISGTWKNSYLRSEHSSKSIIFTHAFLRLLDADFVLFCLWIIMQTRTAVVTLGLNMRTDGYLCKCDAFLLFSSNTWPVKSFRVGLGAYP